MRHLLTITILLACLNVSAQVVNYTNVHVDPGLDVYMYENVTNRNSVSVGSTGLLHVEGTLVNNGTMTFENSASLLRGSTGSDGTGTGNYVVKRQGSSTSGVYNFWSSPMTTHSLNALNASGRYIYNPATGTYTAADDTFDPGWITATGAMVPGKGYTAQGNGLTIYTGDVNNGNVGITVQYFSNVDPTQGGVPFNLVGNPYPSGLSVASFLAGNSSVISGAVYLWDDPGVTPYDSQDYATINSLGTVSNGNGTFNSGSWQGSIASGQGFKIEALPGGGTLTFTNAMRTANNAQFYAMSGEVARIWVQVENDDYSNETLIGFIEDATDGRDHPYDARKIVGQPSLSAYTILNDDSYAIQGFPPLTNLERVIDVGTMYGEAGPCRFRLNNIENFDPEVAVYLEDTETGIWTNLLENPVYSFTAQEGIFPDRFNLHFLPPSITTNMVEQEKVSVHMFSDGNNLVIDFTGVDVNKARVEVFDMLGKYAIAPADHYANNNRIEVPHTGLAAGNYIVRVIHEDEMFSRKIFLK